ncbi:MAG: class I SAM-dependent methyltransferase [Magnetococcales bacterium]|nr:class I SAM-dependent methyltransferase [Magnetococcales bacterium]
MRPDLSHATSEASPLPCLVCHGTIGASRLPGLLHCHQCGFITTDLTLSHAELAAMYGRDYFEGHIYSSYLGEEAGLRKNFQKRLADLKTLLPDPTRCSLFEVGCAYGFFLADAQSLFARVAGMDISAHAIQMAIQRFHLDVRCGDFLQMPETSRYDILCLWDTVEHLARPDLFIQKAAQVLQPNGWLALTTGDIGSLNARLRGAKWRLIHPPYHIHYFSKKTMTALLERCGFEVVQVSHPAVYRSLRMMLYLSCNLRKEQNSRLLSLLDRWSFLDREVPFNLFDLMFVVARKKERPTPDSGA